MFYVFVPWHLSSLLLFFHWRKYLRDVDRQVLAKRAFFLTVKVLEDNLNSLTGVRKHNSQYSHSHTLTHTHAHLKLRAAQYFRSLPCTLHIVWHVLFSFRCLSSFSKRLRPPWGRWPQQTHPTGPVQRTASTHCRRSLCSLREPLTRGPGMHHRHNLPQHHHPQIKGVMCKKASLGRWRPLGVWSTRQGPRNPWIWTLATGSPPPPLTHRAT